MLGYNWRPYKIGQENLPIRLSSVNGRILKIEYSTSVIGVGKLTFGVGTGGRKSYLCNWVGKPTLGVGHMGYS